MAIHRIWGLTTCLRFSLGFELLLESLFIVIDWSLVCPSKFSKTKAAFSMLKLLSPPLAIHIFLWCITTWLSRDKKPRTSPCPIKRCRIATLSWKPDRTGQETALAATWAAIRHLCLLRVFALDCTTHSIARRMPMLAILSPQSLPR